MKIVKVYEDVEIVWSHFWQSFLFLEINFSYSKDHEKSTFSMELTSSGCTLLSMKVVGSGCFCRKDIHFRPSTKIRQAAPILLKELSIKSNCSKTPSIGSLSILRSKHVGFLLASL